MPPDKIKLSPESRRTLLEVALKRSLDEQWSVSDEQKKLLMFNFVKMLCVTNAYLHCSRDTYLDIYRLSLLFTHYSDQIRVLLASKCYEFPDMDCVFLAYDSVRKLIKLLVPSYIGVSFVYGITDANFERCLELLNFTEDTKGKIGLKLRAINDQYVKTLLETFTTRIHEIFSPINRFEPIEPFQFLVFDRLSVHSISNSGQASQILRYKAKELELYLGRQNFTINDNDLVTLKNETVKKLKLNFSAVSGINCVKIEKLVEHLRKSCSNLKHFDIEAGFDRNYEQFPPNQVYGQVFAYVNCIKHLKARFGNGLASMHINFDIDISVYGRHDNTWIKSVCEKSRFEHWQIEPYEEYFDESEFYEYHDKLKMTFYDAVYHLEMTFNVFTHNVEPENEALPNVND